MQPLVNVKSSRFAPPRAIDEICTEAEPVLVRVTFCGPLVTPCVTDGKETVPGARVRAGLLTGCPVPVPLSWAACGESGASSVMEMLAVRRPLPNGENAAPIAQVALTGNAPLQLLVTILKSLGFEPLRRTEEICSVAKPALVKVTLRGALVVPWSVSGNEMVPGTSVTAG